MATRISTSMRRFVVAGIAIGAISVAIATTSADTPRSSRSGVPIIGDIDLDAADADGRLRELFEQDPTAPAPTIIRRRAVQVDRETIRAVATSFDPNDEARLRVDLFPGVRVTAIVEASEVLAEGSVVLTGRLDRLTHGGFALVVHGNAVAGTFHAPQLGAYQIRSREADDGTMVTLVRQVDDAEYAECGCCIGPAPAVPPAVRLLEAGILAPPWENDLAGRAGDGDPPSAAEELMEAIAGLFDDDEGGIADTGSLIDILVVYTTNARVEQGGSVAIQALILLAIAETNQAYANSQIDPRLRLVGWKETSFDETGIAAAVILGDLINPFSGTLDIVHTWRQEAAADLVKLMTADTLFGVAGGGSDCCSPNPLPGCSEPSCTDIICPLDPFCCNTSWDAICADAAQELCEVCATTNISLCGIASIFSTSFTAFSITAAECAAGPRWTFAHEIGHNIGVRHDHAECAADENACAEFPVAPYAYGHGFTGSSGNQHRTIMVRQSQPGVRIQRFSNPFVIFDNVQTGVPIGLPLQAHAAAVHNERAFTVANFRQALPSSAWVDFVSCFPLFQNGSFGNPYCTLQQGVDSLIWGGTLSIKPGTGTVGGITIDKAMTIQAVGGVVTIQ